MKKKLKSSRKINDKFDDPLGGDLSHLLDEGDWQPVQFELNEKKDKFLSIRLSDKLLAKIKKQAEISGIGVQKYVRLVLEKSVQKKTG